MSDSETTPQPSLEPAVTLELPPLRAQIVLMMVSGLWKSGGVQGPQFALEVIALEEELRQKGVRPPAIDANGGIRWGSNLEQIAGGNGAGGKLDEKPPARAATVAPSSSTS